MLLTHIKKTFKISQEKEWFETYWAFDLHGTIMKPTYNLNDQSILYYPFAKETLQHICNYRPDIIPIIWTSSYPNEIEVYVKQFENDGIKFKHINSNPGISSNMGNFGYYETKFYFNVLFEDKAGFDPTKEWEPIYKYLIECFNIGYLPNKNWSKKF